MYSIFMVFSISVLLIVTNFVYKVFYIPYINILEESFGIWGTLFLGILVYHYPSPPPADPEMGLT